MDDAPDATGVYAPLAAQLRQRGILTRMHDGALTVLDDGGEQVDTITARPRPDDGGREWFYDCEDDPLCEADDPIAAALMTVSALHRSGIRA